MTVKMTQRDKKLLSFLAVFLVVVFFGTFAIVPLIDEASNLKQQMEMAKSQQVEMEGKLAQKSQYEEKLNTLTNEWTDVSAQLYPVMQSSDIDALMTSLITQCHLTAVKEDITFVDPEILPVYKSAAPYEEEQPEEKEEKGITTIPMGAFQTAEAVLTVEGSTDEIIALTTQIADLRPGMLLTDIEYQPTGTLMRAKMKILIYMCNKEVE